MKLIIVMAVVLGLTGCTDATQSAYRALGEEAEVICFSGGTVIYKGTSTGKVKVIDAGFTFRSKETKSYVRTNADCIVTVDG